MDLLGLDLYNLEDPLDLDAVNADFCGIEAQDVSSLLLQFEEASQSSEDSGHGSLPSSQPSGPDSLPSSQPNPHRSDAVQGEARWPSTSDSPAKVAAARLKSGMKRKGAIMLPMGVPSDRSRGKAVAILPHCSSPKLQKILLKNSSALLNQPSNIPAARTKLPKPKLHTLSPVNSKVLTKSSESKSVLDVSSDGSSSEVSSSYYSEIADHDYCQNFPHSPTPPACDQSNTAVMTPSAEVLQLTDSDSTQFDQPVGDTRVNTPYPSVNPVTTTRRKITHKEYKHRRRNYRKRDSESEIIPDKTQFFDKIPSYFTTLSPPIKPPKKDSKSERTKCGIKVTDFIQREIAPSLNTTSVYNKLPAYHNCFINSTKYDYSSAPKSVSEIEALNLKNTKYPWDRLRDQMNRENPSRSQSPLLMLDTRCESKSREISCSPSRSRSVSRSRLPRRYRDSSGSTCSSRSSSSDSSHRSRSSERSRRKRQYRRRQRRRERGHSYSSYSSRSSDSEWSSSSRSRSRSYSRSHSRGRSRSRSPRYRTRSKRDASYERRRQERHRQRDEEKKRQIEERRIVYVGKIPETFTRCQLRERFERFGEIEETSVHFRETGDNYGFVTYAYTCDAYAAIEHGNKVAGDLHFDLCFGGRREFCATDYADLDGQVEEEEEFCAVSQRSSILDFDQLLKDAKRKLQK